MFKFDNVGQKIMKLAKVIMWIGIILSVISGLVIMFAGGASVEISGIQQSMRSGISAASVVCGIFVAFLGALFSWIGSLATYGFGQMIDDLQAIREKAEKEEE